MRFSNRTMIQQDKLVTSEELLDKSQIEGAEDQDFYI